ncbi:MAG: hypothetical protein RLZZ522_738, partial [Verrucomicrobiota bacterium]
EREYNMKQLLHSLLAGAALALIPTAFAADGHDHAKKVAGPNGGLIITAVEPHCELLVTPERKLKITFLGADGKAVALKAESLTGTGGDRTKPTKFTFVKVGESLVSEQPLPAGESIPLILQIKTAADAKPVTKRVALNLAHCPGCNLAEYACTCDSH